MVRTAEAFDVIVIGAGWGGLSTAALLSRKGARVLLAEARAVPGGRASYRERDGFLVDYGIHAHRFGPDGAAAKVYRELGETLDLVEPEQSVVYHDGGFHSIPRKIGRLIGTDIVSARTKLALSRTLAGLAARRPGRNYSRAVADILRAGQGEETRSMISTVAGLGLTSPDLDNTSAGEFIWFLRRAARAGRAISFPRGGCAQHVRKLDHVVRENGEVRTGFRVERILIDRGAVAGVEGKAEAVHSRAVVTAFPLQGVGGLLPPGTLDSSLEYRMGVIRPTAGISWDMGLRKPVSDVHAVFSTDPLTIGAFNSNFDPDLCPEGKQLASWFTVLPLSAFESPGRLKVEEQVLRAHVFQMFPRIRGNIEWDRMMRLPVVDGAMPAFWQPWPDRPAPGDSDVPGLFFAGDTVGVPGQGGDIAFRSAIVCAKAVLSYLG